MKLSFYSSKLYQEEATLHCIGWQLKTGMPGNFRPERVATLDRSFQESTQTRQVFCKAAKIEEIAKHDFILTPGRYVGIPDEEDDGIPFDEKIEKLTAKLSEQFAKSNQLEEEIKKNLGGLGFDI